MARVTAIEQAVPNPSDEDYKRLEATLAAALGNDVMQEFTLALREAYSVSVNRAALDAYFANQP